MAVEKGIIPNIATVPQNIDREPTRMHTTAQISTINEVLPKISENSLDHSKEISVNASNPASRGPVRIMNLKMFKKKKEQE